MGSPLIHCYFAILSLSLMNSLRTPFGIARFSTSIASDPEAAQRRHASFADRRTIINLSKPVPLRPCARGTISALPLENTPTRGAIDTYFAISSPTFSRGTTYSRHDRPPAPSRFPLSDNIPPPYDYPSNCTFEDEEARLPSYSEHFGPCDDDKPFLLAKFLFKYGFGRCFPFPPRRPNIGPFVICFRAVFPPFWFFSIFILLIPLAPPPTWEIDKSPPERASLLCHVRNTERMWALRSLCAAGVFSGLVALTVAIFIVAMHAV